MEREGGSGQEIVRGTARLLSERLRFQEEISTQQEKERERVNDKERLMNERWEQNIWRGDDSEIFKGI